MFPTIGNIIYDCSRIQSGCDLRPADRTALLVRPVVENAAAVVLAAKRI